MKHTRGENPEIFGQLYPNKPEVINIHCSIKEVRSLYKMDKTTWTCSKLIFLNVLRKKTLILGWIRIRMVSKAWPGSGSLEKSSWSSTRHSLKNTDSVPNDFSELDP